MQLATSILTSQPGDQLTPFLLPVTYYLLLINVSLNALRYSVF